MKTLIILGSLFLLALSGCQIVKTKAYEGDELPLSETAIVKGDRCFEIYKVDGKSGYYTAGIFRGSLVSKGFEIQLLPGEHTIEVGFSCHRTRSVHSIPLKFTAKKNTIYNILYRLNENKTRWHVWIQESNQVKCQYSTNNTTLS